MIRFAPQTIERAANATRIAAEPKPAAISAIVADTVSNMASATDDSMLLVELPEVPVPGKTKAAKTRAARKPKATPELPVAQLALDA